MIQAKVYTQQGQEKGLVDLPDEVFAQTVNEALLHQVIKSYLANMRQGTAKTKTRAEVSGGGKKPWRQKGTGRARSGSNTSPVWVRGGTAFGPKPRDYSATIPKKMRKSALCSAYSIRAQEEKIVVIDSMVLNTPKTSGMSAILKGLSASGKRNLMITGAYDKNVYLAGRNIPDLTVKTVEQITAYDVMRNENIIFNSEQLIGKVKEVAVP